MKRNTLAILIIGLLTTSLTASERTLQSPPIAGGSPNGEEIDTRLEYSNGSIGSPHSGLSLWYTWINTSDTQIIYLAYQSYVLNPPVITFLGQHYYTENETEVFVGNTLTSIEVFNDTNGNGVPDTDLVSGKSETLYYFLVNSSASFAITPLEKSLINNVPHYEWGIRYGTIDACLIYENGYPATLVMLDYLALSYDFYIQNNVSYLKTNFSIGKILDKAPLSRAGVTLEGLGLSLLYGTTFVTMKPYVALVNGEPYNSTTVQVSAMPTESGEIRIENTKAYEVLFGQDYTLFGDSQEEIHESKSAAVADRSVSGNLRVSVEWLLHDLEDVLSQLFPKVSGMKAPINLDYSVSSLIYRVCYPKWEGCRLEHDPTYVAYLNAAVIPEISPPIMFVITAALLGLVTLTAALVDLRKTRKMLRPSMRNSPPM